MRAAAGGGAGTRPGAPGPPGPDDRCLLHDPVRRSRRSADRPGLPLRWLRDRQSLRRDRDHNTLFNLPDPGGSTLVTHCSTAASSPTSARSSSSWEVRHSASWCPPSPATSPTRSPTARASPPGSSWVPSPSLAFGLAHRLHRRHHRRCPRRSRRPLDHALEGAYLGARPDAGPGHPAVGHPDQRLRDDHPARQAAREAHGRSSTAA